MSQIFFREEGSGMPLVLIHGFCETHEIWKDFIEPLSRLCRVITPDLPGFGKSERLPGEFTIDDVGDSINSWMEINRLENSIVIGHSLGGYVALSLADRHPIRLRGLGLFHSTAFADSPEKKVNRNKTIDFVRKHGVEPFVETFVPGLYFDKAHPSIPFVHRIASQTSLETLAGYSQAMRDRPDRREMLAKNEIPKILIAGTEDTLITLENSNEMAKMSQNYAFYALQGVGHMGFFEDKKQCQLIITRFTEAVNSNN